MSYIIALCSRCKAPAYFKEGKKTWKCPYCSYVNEADKSKAINRATSIKDAITIIQELKKAKSTSSGQEPFKRASELS